MTLSRLVRGTSLTKRQAWKLNSYAPLLYKHQWNTKWAFARKLHIFTRDDHCRYGYVINRAIFTGVYVINRILHARLWIWIFLFVFNSAIKHSKIEFVSTARACNILYILHKRQDNLKEWKKSLWEKKKDNWDAHLVETTIFAGNWKPCFCRRELFRLWLAIEGSSCVPHGVPLKFTFLSLLCF